MKIRKTDMFTAMHDIRPDPTRLTENTWGMLDQPESMENENNE